MIRPSVKRHRTPRSGAGWFLLLLVPALLLPSSTAQGESSSGQDENSLSRLVQLVIASDENAQQDFSWIALSELAAAYEKVYQSSGSEVLKEKRARDKLISWRSGTQRYISELHALLERLPGSVELQIQAGEAGPPVIVIDGRPVVISGPEIGSSMLMEKRITDIYCALYDCGELSGKADRPSAVSAGSGGVWTLKNSGKASYETADGLIFTFSGISGRKAKEQISEDFAAEIRGLRAGLRDATEAGHRIDWNNLDIQPLAGGRGHRVQFNLDGEYLRMTLPGLAQPGALSPEVLAWIRRSAIDGMPAEVEIFADRLLPGPGGIGFE